MLLAFQNDNNFNSTIFYSGDILQVSLVMFGYMVKNAYIWQKILTMREKKHYFCKQYL